MYTVDTIWDKFQNETTRRTVLGDLDFTQELLLCEMVGWTTNKEAGVGRRKAFRKEQMGWSREGAPICEKGHWNEGCSMDI